MFYTTCSPSPGSCCSSESAVSAQSAGRRPRDTRERHCGRLQKRGIRRRPRDSAPRKARGESAGSRLALPAPSRPRRGPVPASRPPSRPPSPLSAPRVPGPGRGAQGSTCQPTRPGGAPTHVALQLPLGGRLDEPARAHGVARAHRGRRRRRFLQLGRRCRRKSGRGCRRGGPSVPARPGAAQSPRRDPRPRGAGGDGATARGPDGVMGRRLGPGRRWGSPFERARSVSLSPIPGATAAGGPGPAPAGVRGEEPAQAGRKAGAPLPPPTPTPGSPWSGSRAPLPQTSLSFGYERFTRPRAIMTVE